MTTNNIFKNILDADKNKDSLSSDDEFPEEIGKFIGGAFRHILKEASKAQRVQKEKETLESLKKKCEELLAQNTKLKEHIKELESEKLDKIIYDLD
jgi:predicted RNase H-like nuclease (RuvC/YqgF family)